MGNSEETLAPTAVVASWGRRLVRLLWQHKSALIGFIIVMGFAITAVVQTVANILGVQITPYNPITQNVGPPLGPISWAHLFGTDILGRDVFSRVIAAAPNDLFVSIAVVGAALVVGLLIGSYAAFRGALFDEGLMRITDVFFALPGLVLAMVISVVLGPGVINMMFALMIIWWPTYARIARGQALKIAHQNYIEAARLSGRKRFGILIRHVVPNILSIMLVYATLDIGTVVLVYSALSYLGLAVRPPFPEWGGMVSDYQDYMLTAPWLPLIPGAVIAFSVIGFSLLGDGIRDSMEEF